MLQKSLFYTERQVNQQGSTVEGRISFRYMNHNNRSILCNCLIVIIPTTFCVTDLLHKSSKIPHFVSLLLFIVETGIF